MATQNYLKLQKQIADLQAQAAKLKSEEVAGVVARIKEAIAAYGLTDRDLFDSKSSSAKRMPKAKKALVAMYIDGKGGQWVGRGKRPKWLNDALASGKQLEDFLAEKFEAAIETFGARSGDVAAPARKAAPKKVKTSTKTMKARAAAEAKKPVSSAKYSDGTGNTWTGKGPAPKWLKEALAGGKAREEFLVQK